MSKIAVVYSFEESNWFSCVKIVGNLLKSYHLLSDTEIIPVNFNENLLKTGLKDTAKQIIELNADKIIFLDHKPHPNILIKEIFKICPDFNNEFIFHVYGDFTLYFYLWMDIDLLLKGKKVKFLCASDKQVELVQGFMESSETFVEKLPFPVDKNEFYFKEKSNDVRAKHGLEKDDKILIYTGRLSLQKNIVDLVELFFKAQKDNQIDENTYLFLAGEFDSLGFSFGNIYHHLGEYYRAFDRILQSYSEDLKSKVKLLGKISNEQLIDYYNSSNLFVSLSTYHDEDYGMSVAEAGACGLPLLLTDWAGFSSFMLSNQCQKIKTFLTDEGPYFSKEDAYKKLITICNEKKSEKTLQSEIFLENLSVEACGKKLEKFINFEPAPFGGFNSLMYKLGRDFKTNSRVFFNDPDHVLDRYYFKVYDVYASKN